MCHFDEEEGRDVLLLFVIVSFALVKLGVAITLMASCTT